MSRLQCSEIKMCLEGLPLVKGEGKIDHPVNLTKRSRHVGGKFDRNELK